MALQDLPEVPKKVSSSEEVDDILDLPNVPTKAAVAGELVDEKSQDASAGISAATKGYFLHENFVI